MPIETEQPPLVIEKAPIDELSSPVPYASLKVSTNEPLLRSLREDLSKLEGSDVGFKIDTEDLLGYAYAREKYGVQQRSEVKDVDEENKTVTVEYLTGQRDVVSYNEIINMVNKQEEDGDELWSFKGTKNHRKRKGKWELLVDWNNCLLGSLYKSSKHPITLLSPLMPMPII